MKIQLFKIVQLDGFMSDPPKLPKDTGKDLLDVGYGILNKKISSVMASRIMLTNNEIL